MSNWFEENPVRSVITHTFVVAGITWASFIFVFDENKANVHKAEVENLQAQVGQYKAKVEVLESRISHLTLENSKLHNWLINTPKTIPYLENEVTELTAKNTELAKANAQKSFPTTIQGETETPYYNIAIIEKGGAFFDPATTASIGVNRFNPDYTADIQLTLPGKTGDHIKNVKPGTQWKFTHNGKNYIMVLHETNWASNIAKASIQELEIHNK